MRLRKETKGVLLMSLFIFLPSFIYVTANAPSMAYGVFGVSLIALWTLKFRISRFALNRPFFLFLLGTLFLQLIFLIYNNPSLKEIGSLVFLFLLAISAAALEFFLRQLEPEKILYHLRKLSLLIVMLGSLSLLHKFQFLGYQKFPKAVFPFSEPSHFVISTSAILFFNGFFLKSYGKIILILIIVVQALFYPSAIMLFLGIMMMIFYYVRKPGKFLFFGIIISTIGYLLLTQLGALSYFEDRLNFSEEASNITTLVYLQGWEDAYLALIETNGLGLGFQNMGTLEPGKYGKMIYQILGEYKNREDAGFLAAKIVGEFGLIGVGFILYYLHLMIRSSVTLFRFMKRRDYSSNLTIDIFAHSIIITFFLELFLRGYGYFSPGVFLFFVALFLICNRKIMPNYARPE
ncbi:hypothetical protein G3I01_02325 [Gramella sp. MT6]|uniref:hypothetical protein n=1 Tax=Gramella sp. MT6 TaxID=2705471 RepID=UPI001C5E48E4|nr:hypothetical protein [Gramella sp. MT6]QYA24391.1 hypothetical protein G3I01_02325 [Gramella sp. MT6]